MFLFPGLLCGCNVYINDLLVLGCILVIIVVKVTTNGVVGIIRDIDVVENPRE
jgi:hypothetical protein